MAQANQVPDNSPDDGQVGPPSPSSPKISPYLLMQAQQEAQMAKATGKMPPVGGAVHQLGMAGLAANHPAAIQGARQAVGGASPQPSPTSPSPATGSVGNAPAQGQVGPPAPSVANGGVPQDPKQALLDDIGKKMSVLQAMGVKNPYASDTNEESQKSSSNMKQDIGAAPGTYSRGVGEAQGYSYAPIYGKKSDGTDDMSNIVGYTKSDSPDPNSPFQKQQSAIEKLNDLVAAKSAKLPTKRPLDLTGLMMAADFANNTDHFGKDYAGQRAAANEGIENDQKQDQQNFQDQAEALKQQGDLYKQAQQGGLGIMGGGQVGSANQILTVAKQIEGAGNPKGAGGNPNQGKMTDQQFNQYASGLAQTGQKKDSALNDLARMLSLGNPTADNMSVVAGAKAMAGTSRINTTELSMLKNPDSSLWGRVDQIMGRAGNGQYTPEDRAQLAQLYQQLSSGRQAEAKANTDLISHANTLRINPEDDGIVRQLYGTAMQPNVGNTSVNLRKPGHPNNVTPVNPNQNYNGSTPLPANATPAMKQARLHYLKSKASQ